MALLAGQRPSLELILRQRVALIPGMLAEVLAGLRMFVARHCPRRQERNGGLRCAGESRKRCIVAAESLCVTQAADELIVRVGWEAVVAVETTARVDRR